MEEINIFLEKLNLNNLDENEKLIKVVKAVSEIPWGEGRDIEEVFKKKVGTCTGKHKILEACFDKLGIKYQTVVCTFKWGEQGIIFPQELQKILNEGEWEHGHNFIKLENGNYVDITWDGMLKPFGFKIIPADWTPRESFIGVQNIIRKWEGVQIDEKKKELIENLDSITRKRRGRFLKLFIEWINFIHNSK